MATLSIAPTTTPQMTVIQGLHKAVAQSYALLALSHNAHVNITGRDFFPLHSVLGDIYNGALADADLFAERIRALDSFCHICLTELDKESGLPCLKTPFNAQEAIVTIINAQSIIINDLTGLMNLADSTGDKVTSNLLQDKIAQVQKSNWMLKSYLK